MAQSTLGLIILAVTVAFLIWGRLSVSVVLTGACCAMALSGILTFSQAFYGFSSGVVWLLIALMVIGAAFQQVGLMDIISAWILRMAGNNEKRFIVLMYIASAVCSWLVNGIIVLVVFMAVTDKLSIRTNGAITRKHVYYPIALGSAYGSLCSSVGSSAMMNVSSQLGASEFGRAFHLLETFPIGIAVTLAGLLFYLTIGYPLQKRVFTFSEIRPETVVSQEGESVSKQDRIRLFIISAVLVLTIIIVAFEIIDTGIASVIAILLLIITRCVGEKECYKSIDWHVVFCVVGALGFGRGVSESGAGQVLANVILQCCSGFAHSPFAMCVICMAIGIVLSNFMANNSAAAIIVPIAFGIAQLLDTSLLPFAIACGLGVNMAVMTPVCRTTVTMTLSAGYKFKHLAIVGGLITVITGCIAAVGLKIMYF